MSERPEIAFGDRFRIQSLRGSRYLVTLLGVGQLESGLYVRLDDGRIARLDERRLRWDTYEPTSHVGDPPLREGDEVLAETSAGVLRGTLLEPPGAEVALRLSKGADRRLPRGEVDELNLLFRARDLKSGDRIVVNSKSGNEYRGLVRALGPGRRLQLRLDEGGNANLRLSKIDLSSLLILIKVAWCDAVPPPEARV
jgi:hypothetical protein